MKKTIRLISGVIAALMVFSSLSIAAPVPTFSSQGDLSDIVRAPFTGAVLDTTPPNVNSCTALNYSTSSASSFIATAVAGLSACLSGASAIDNIDGAVGVTNNAPASYAPLTTGSQIRVYNITFSATDSSGNVGTSVLVFTITYNTPLDTTPPVVTPPLNITIQEATAGSGVPATNATIQAFLLGGSGNDIVDGVLTATASSVTGTLLVGTYNVTFSSTDLSGITGTSIATITITAAPASGVGNGICTTAVDDGAGNITRGSNVSHGAVSGFAFIDVVACSPGGRGYDGNTAPAYYGNGSHHGKPVPGTGSYIDAGNRTYVNLSGNITVYGGGSGTATVVGLATRCSGCGPTSGTKTYIDGNSGVGNVGGSPVCASILGGPTVCSGSGGNSPLGKAGASGSCQKIVNIPAQSFTCHVYGTSSDNYAGVADPYKGGQGNVNWKFHN